MYQWHSDASAFLQSDPEYAARSRPIAIRRPQPAAPGLLRPASAAVGGDTCFVGRAMAFGTMVRVTQTVTELVPEERLVTRFASDGCPVKERQYVFVTESSEIHVEIDARHLIAKTADGRIVSLVRLFEMLNGRPKAVIWSNGEHVAPMAPAEHRDATLFLYLRP